jgi:acetyl-CoA synthetase
MSEPSFDFGGEIVWRPTPEIIAQPRLKQFMEQHGLATFDELLRYATTGLEWFRDAVLKFLDIQFYKPYSQVVELHQGIEWPQWCVGGVLNIIHNCLDRRIGAPAQHKAAWKRSSERCDF